MKKFLAIIGTVLLVLAGFYIHAASQAERNARLINFRNDLRDAQLRLRAGEGITNRYRHTRIYAFTNSYVINGTNYYCELAGENEWIPSRGPLAITTN
ncbi:MAG TPA: hypothetical protein VNT26_20555, partial [Candidatus Sulfotelmatobacter sp.]|nr:hypothetical protein [Candidatus Sulfotelmatobacter sp.]